MTDTFVSDVTTSIRRSLFQRLKTYGFSQSELTGIVAGAAKRAVERARVADLASLAALAGPVAVSLEAVAPTDAALLAFKGAAAAVSDDVRQLVDAPTVDPGP